MNEHAVFESPEDAGKHLDEILGRAIQDLSACQVQQIAIFAVAHTDGGLTQKTLWPRLQLKESMDGEVADHVRMMQKAVLVSKMAAVYTSLNLIIQATAKDLGMKHEELCGLVAAEVLMREIQSGHPTSNNHAYVKQVSREDIEAMRKGRTP